LYRKGPLAFYHGLWRKYGDVVGIPFGPITQYLLARPDDVQHVLLHNWRNYCKGTGWREVQRLLGAGLLTSEGRQWQRQRRLAQPFFQARAGAAFAGALGEAVEALLRRWHGREGQGEPIDVMAEMTRMTTSVTARALLGCDGGEALAAVGGALTTVTDFLSRRMAAPVPVPLWLPTPANRRFHGAIRTVHAFLDGLIARRRREPGGQPDLLALLVKAHDHQAGPEADDGQLRDEVATLLLAGYETTPVALTWTWYLLAGHPEAEARLHDELEHVPGGRPLGLADLPGLPFTLRVLQESMRLYPPVPLFVRDALAADEAGGYHIPAGSMVLLCPHVTHRHPGYWDEPERFDPDRFTAERSAGRPVLAYYPFGGGPRVCIGQHLALLQMHMALAALARHYHLRPVPGQRVEPVFGATLLPRHPLRATLHRRR
jgi:cytochrome P450